MALAGLIPHTAAPLMDLLSGLDGTFTYLTTHQQMQIHTQTLATPTPLRVGTAMAVPSQKHFWQEEVIITFNRMK